MRKIMLWLIVFVATTVMGEVLMEDEYVEKNGLIYHLDGKTKLNGVLMIFDRNKILRSETDYTNGKKDGIEKEYSRTNKDTGYNKYKNGRYMTGMQWSYYESGELESRKACDVDYHFCSQETYYISGALKSETKYKNGWKTGVAKGYYESGALLFEVTTKDGKAISGTLYKENGKKDRKMTNADYRRYGFVTFQE